MHCNRHRRTFSCSLLILLTATACFAQKKYFTYEEAYASNRRQAQQGSQFREWLDDETYIETASSGTRARITQLLKVQAATGESSVYLDFCELNQSLPEGFMLQKAAVRSRDYEHFIFNQQDDLYYFRRSSGALKRLTASASRENNPKLSPDNRAVAFTRDHNLFVLDLDSGLEHQLTEDGSETLYNGWASWVYFEEILGRGGRYAAFWWSPNSEMIAFLQFDDSPVPTFPIYRADGTHGELEIQRYPKPGDPNPYVRLGIAHIKERKVTWVDNEEKANHYVAWPFWTPDSKQLFFQWMNRGQDNIKIYTADPATGKKDEIYDERQSSWVEFFEDLYFLKDGSGFIIRSDKDGWAHLYYYDMQGKLKRQLTSGSWRVTGLSHVDESNKRIYFHHTLGDATEVHLSSVKLNGKALTRLTNKAGRHRCTVSPEGSYFVDRHNSIAHASRTELYRMDGDIMRSVGKNDEEIGEDYALGKVELFTIDSSDGYALPAIWVLPPDFDESKKYPVIFEIYGGPGSTTAINAYQRKSRHFMAQNGIIVISVDHRGSNHFGKTSRALMHRNLGKWEMHDLTVAVKWLRKQPFIDPLRIGISGHSYGGYTTCMALTQGAEYFTHGIAGSPVTDWRLYDTVYTERYMDTPAENPEGYEFGSAMRHANNYKGVLRITHGTMDDNVHMQNSLQLIDELTTLNQDFEMMIYPNARHGYGDRRAHANRESVQFWFRHFLGKELQVMSRTRPSS